MLIEVKNLSKNFKGVEILKNVNLKFNNGKIYGLVGRNGSGKSVFLKLLCGFYIPSIGTITFDSVDYIKEKGFPLDTRALIEKPNFLADLSGFENLKLLASLQNKITDNEIIKTLEDVNLIEEKDKKYSKYSLGMKQKLGIAQVLMENPKIMIFDEPFNGIEEATVKKIKKILLEEKKKDKLIIISSHIKEDIEELADEVYLFDGGLVNKK
jgi:ABC-2 type transport system ATP-binding protein